MKLTQRLKALYDLIPQDSVLVDIGTDHGYLVIKAVKDNKVRHAYGLDIGVGPLNQAKQNIKQYGLENNITLMLLDGLKGFEADANCYVIAGMGAETIYSIISNKDFKEDDIILIQSNTKNAWLRKELNKLGFRIRDEVFLIERNKPVFIMALSLGSQNLTEEEILLGPILLKAENESYYHYLLQRLSHLETIKQHRDVDQVEIDSIKNYIKERK